MPDNFGLQAFEHEGVMLIEWNLNARSVDRAASAKASEAQ